MAGPGEARPGPGLQPQGHRGGPGSATRVSGLQRHHCCRSHAPHTPHTCRATGAHPLRRRTRVSGTHFYFFLTAPSKQFQLPLGLGGLSDEAVVTRTQGTWVAGSHWPVVPGPFHSNRHIPCAFQEYATSKFHRRWNDLVPPPPHHSRWQGASPERARICTRPHSKSMAEPTSEPQSLLADWWAFPCSPCCHLPQFLAGLCPEHREGWEGGPPGL